MRERDRRGPIVGTKYNEPVQIDESIPAQNSIPARMIGRDITARSPRWPRELAVYYRNRTSIQTLAFRCFSEMHPSKT